MTNHQKPTKEELKAGMDATIAEIETPPATPPATPPEPPVAPPAPPVTPEPPKEGEEPVTPPATPPATPPVTPESKKPEVDWEKKYKASSREAQLEGYKNKEIQTAVDQASQLPDPTEDQLKTEYSDWDDMTDTEKRLAKDNLLNRFRFEKVHEATAKFKNVDEWNEKVNEFVVDPAVLADFPELEGKEDEFKHFASLESRRGIDFKTLVLAFSGELAKTKPEPKKGQMFEQGSGGPVVPPKVDDGKISVAEGDVLRVADYKQYVAMLKAGKIRTE